MLILLQQFFIKDLKESFPNKWLVFTSIGSSLMSLVFYWYTAKALAPKFELFKNTSYDYFTFIVIGEVGLAIPLSLMINGVQQFKEYFVSGTLEVFFSCKTSFRKIMIVSIFSETFLILVHCLITIIFAVTIFELKVIGSYSLYAVLLQISAIPFFLALGLIALSFFVFFGRGAGIISSASGLISMLAGTYFPTAVFPEFLHHFLTKFSPFNTLLNETRKVLTMGRSSTTSESMYLLFGLGVILLPISLEILRLGLNQHRKRGTSLFYS